MVLTAPRPIRADTPGEAIPTPKGFFDNFTLGVKSGWQETTLNLLRDQSILQNAQYQKNAGIPQTEWNEANPLYVEGLEWFEGLNYEMVRRAHETLELSKQMQTAKDNSTGFDYAGQFVGMLGSAFLDPINYIPLPIARFGKSLLTKATMVGGVNAGIEASLFPVMKDAYRTRGREFGFEEAAVNAMFAFGAGATLYGGFAGLAKGMRAMNLGPAPKTIADNLITQRRNQHPEYDIEQTIGDLLNKNIVTLRNNGFDNIRDFKFNINSIENFYVDTSGKIFRNLDDGANITTTKDFIEVVTDTTGTIILRGPSKALTKILPTISRNSSSDVKFRIEDTDAQRTLEANREQINEFANQEAKALNKTTITSSEKVFNKLFNIDNTKSLTTLDDLDDLFVIKGTEYEIEPDAVRGINFDENIGRIIRNQNGKRTVITDQTERKAVIESLRKQLTDEGFDPGTDTIRTNQIESYETKVDNNLQPNREADTQQTMRVVSRIDETNEVDAGRTPEELENVKTATATRSQAVETITQTYNADLLRTYGLEIRNNDLIDVGDIDEIYTRAITKGGYGMTRESVLASKARIKSLFKRIKDKETIETATKEYNICRRS